MLYRYSLDDSGVWVKTGIRRGGLDQLVVLNRIGLTALFRATEAQDRQRSLARVLQHLTERSKEVG